MEKEKITYEDVHEYASLFTIAPAILLESFAKRGTNLVLKFKPAIESQIEKLTDIQKEKLEAILSMDTEELQNVMQEAYEKTNLRQYAVLAKPEYRQFIKDNLDEIRNMIYK